VRDEFLSQVKDTLARRVGLHCSNPVCGKRTSGPAGDPSQTMNIGVAAHITAASPGGPRYDATLAESERRSIHNGIWLCADCARLIDSDPQTFTIATLRNWKTAAERTARESLEQPHGQATTNVACEIRALRNDLSVSLDALRASRWRPNDSDNAAARTYLCSIFQSAVRLSDDAHLLSPDAPPPYVAVDFSELYAYAASNAELLVGTPLVDYCIERSSISLLMPPGTVYELQNFVRGLRHDPRDVGQGTGLKSLEKFVKHYEQAPDSERTRRAYEEALRAILSSGALLWSGFSRLKGALGKGLITPIPNGVGGLARMGTNDEVRHFFLLFERLRPERTKGAANWADAVNLSILVNAHSEMCGRARMISSASSFAVVAAMSVSGHLPVRTSREYAIFLRLVADQKPETAAAALTTLQDHIGELLAVVDRDDAIDARHLPILRSFADVYRRVFSPIDEMIRDALSALPKQQAKVISEFYHHLVEEADLARGFRRWWDMICEELNGIDQELEASHMAKEIRGAIDDYIG
jgi:hypothetical protein